MAEEEVVEETTEKPADQYQETINELKERHAALTSEHQSTREELAEMRGRLEATPPAPPAKEFTREELRKAVEDETLTQEAADTILEKQLETRLEAKATERATAAAEAATRKAEHDAAIALYTEAHPDLADKGSATFQKVQKKYQELISKGQPVGGSTELVALEMALGSAKIPADRTREARETHVETGSGGGGKDERPVDAANKVPKHYRAHYQHMIAEGYYSGWDDPKIKAELPYMTRGSR
jgi:hypothetical protein